MAGWVERRMNAEASALPEAVLAPTALEKALAHLEPAAETEPVAPPARHRREIIEGVLAAKVAQAFLANRLQTAFSLAMNLSARDEASAGLLLETIAAALDAGNAEPRPIPQDLLATIRAPEGADTLIAAAIARPRPLAGLLRALEAASLQADAYALSVVALPRPGAAETAYLDYLAARFQLTEEVVRGIRRRFQR